MTTATKYSQKAFLFHRADFMFADKHLEYTIEDEKSKIGFFVAYDAISPKKSFQTYRERWSVYIARALMPGMIASFYFAHTASFDNRQLQCMYWVSLIGMLALAALHRFPKFKADVIETPEGKILVFDRPHRQEIIDEIYLRRSTELRRKYLAIDPFNDPQAEIQKYRQLKDDNVITGQEYTDAVDKLLARRDKP